eukprot:jgi/Pico_ML_1/54108/g4531.t1
MVEPLAAALVQTLSPDAGPRKQAESFLKEAAKQPGYGSSILQLVASEQVDPQVRQSAAVNFKNHVKKHWDASRAQGISEAPVEIGDAEKEQIKTAITSLVLHAPQAIQVQLSEALAIISETDFPTKWPTLLPELSSKLGSGDYRIIQGALHTANSIFRRYRRKMEMDQEEANELKYVLDTFAVPLTELMTVTTASIQQTNDVAALKQMLSCVRLICRMFYSLNYHVLPEVFEDRMNEWFSHFQFFLGYNNPALNESDPEKESCIDGVKSAICENINLYIEKNEEEFEPFLPQFASSVWSLLAGASQAPGQDHLVASAMRFLTTVAKSIHHKLFADPQVLKQVIEGIVIPNLQVREEDEELFDMNWVEYAYLEKSSEEIVQSSKLEGVLGVFQKLIASRSHDHEGFFILNTLVEFLPLNSFSKYLQTIWSLLCQRLMASRTAKYARSFVVFCCMFICKHGTEAMAESLDSVQSGLFLNILQGVFVQDAEKISGKEEEKRSP